MKPCIFCCSCCSCCYEKEKRIKISFIIILFCGFVNFFLSFAVLFVINSNENIFTRAITVVDFLYNLYLFVFGIIRLKCINKYSKFCILFSFILSFGNFLEVLMPFFHFIFYDYKWANVLNIIISAFARLSLLPTIYLFFELLYSDCVSDNCIEKDFFCICSILYKYIESCCNLFNRCCISCGESCKKCNGRDYPYLRKVNNRLNEENNN